MLHDHVYMHACSLSLLVSVKCFCTLKLINNFIVALSTKPQDLSKQQKMSNITTEQKDLKYIVNRYCPFLIVRSPILYIDDYLFTKETVMSGLKRKKEPENIVGTKKSKKMVRRL